MAHSIPKLVTFGEAMIRLSPPEFRRLEQAHTLDFQAGGAELNVAIAAHRLGLPASFVTRLTRNPLGRMIENKAREHGVDTSCIAWTDADRVGIYFIEFGAAPRPNAVLYDRRDSAVAHVRPGEIDWECALRGAGYFHTSGITPALSASTSTETIEAVRTARRLGVCVSVDLNYRARLWTQEEACRVMSQVVSEADILITTEEDTARVFGISAPSYEEVARRLAHEFALDAVVITLRETPSVWRNTWSAMAYDAHSDVVTQAPTFDIEVVDRVGSGDAFAGGFLAGYAKDGIELGSRWGVAVSAMKQTLPGDFSWATLEDVERLLAGGSLRIVR